MACSFVCCALVVASFALFAFGSASGASKTQVAELNSSTPPGTRVAPPVSSTAHVTNQPRRFIDGAAHALTSPFRSFIHSTSVWAVEIASTLLALVAYGLGLGYLARWART